MAASFDSSSFATTAFADTAFDFGAVTPPPTPTPSGRIAERVNIFMFEQGVGFLEVNRQITFIEGNRVIGVDDG